MRRKRLIPRIIFLVLVLWIPVEMFLSNNSPVLQEYSYTNEKIPEEFSGFRIVHLSDMHEKDFGKDNKTVHKLVEKANPDIIVITGDMFQSYEGVDYALKQVEYFVSIAPVYYVTGNHEWEVEWDITNNLSVDKTSVMQKIKSGFHDLGVVILDNKVLELEQDGKNIILAGLCDPNGYGMDIATLTEEVKEKDPEHEKLWLLLSHRYNMLDDYAACEFDFVLSGHSHGGLIRLPFTDGLFAPGGEFLPKNTAGECTKDNTTMFVSRGLGDTYAPRFLNRPDVILEVLHSE